MSKWITRVVVSTAFLVVASLLLSPRFSIGEIMGFYLLVVAAVI